MAKQETKPGVKTTEFWVTLALILLNIAGALTGKLPPAYAGVASTVIGALYTVVRGYVKSK